VARGDLTNAQRAKPEATWPANKANARCPCRSPRGRPGDSLQFKPVLDAIRVPRLGPGRDRTHPDEVADKACSSRDYRAELRRRGPFGAHARRLR
jgi:hypothetical protein